MVLITILIGALTLVAAEARERSRAALKDLIDAITKGDAQKRDGYRKEERP